MPSTCDNKPFPASPVRVVDALRWPRRSSAGGEVAARMYTITGSADCHNLNRWAYLDDVVRTLAGCEADLEALPPNVWAKTHPESIRTYREAEAVAQPLPLKLAAPVGEG